MGDPMVGTSLCVDRPTLRRSLVLFRSFLVEQSDPDRFYRVLAGDSVRQVGCCVDLVGRTVLDVGGGPGYFAEAFRAAGARYLGVDPDVGELSARGEPDGDMVRASGLRLPIRDGVVDVCYSSNVLEHVSLPWVMLGEMCRVTRPGGLVVASFTPWWSPWGGHETAPWHYFGGSWARRRYRRRYGVEPKNRFGESLFRVGVGEAVRWAGSRSDMTLVRAFPRYHPWWAWWIIRVPVLREFASWNLMMVLRRNLG